jgi:NAD(P)-dependent dehydrogenase (short-subunit alcohol dehydrogenase family)
VDIAGTVALVTGAGSGLGAATARRLAADGAIVVGLDRDGDGLSRILAEVPDAIGVAGDLADTAAVTRAVEAATTAGELRVVVNCAATGLPPTRTVRRNGEVQPLEPWRRVVEVNLVAAYDVTRQAAGAMALQPELASGGRGVIVHTSSIAGLDGTLGVSAYASSKYALTAMVHSTARDLSVWGIRVLAVAPGAFDTPAFSGLPEAIKERRHREFVYPRRPGRPEEFASFVRHLVGNDYLNAECFRIDAGLRMPE